MLNSITLDAPQAKTFIHPNGNKLIIKQIATEVGYGLKAVNISQSFKDLINQTEEVLREQKLLTSDSAATVFWSSPTGHFPKGVFILNG